MNNHNKEIQAPQGMEVSEEKVKPPEEISEKEKQDQVFKETFGTTNTGVVKSLLGQAANTHPDFQKESGNNQALSNISAVLHGIAPRDELEGMLAVQMVGIHNLSMEMMRKATVKGRSPSDYDSLVNQVTKLTRTFTAQVEALNRYRSGGKQSMRVEHIHVNDGGQAVIGNVAKEGGGKKSGK